MKRLMAIAVVGLLCFSCKKENSLQNTGRASGDNYLSAVMGQLKDSLSGSDYGSLDFSHAITSGVDSLNIHLLRIPIQGKAIASNFLLVKTDVAGDVLKGRFVSVAKDSSQKSSFTGNISYRSFKSVNIGIASFQDGRASVGSQSNVAPEPAVDGGDLPPVIVVAYISNGGISYADWYNLEDMVGDAESGYSGYYSPSSGGGGGGGVSTAPTEQVDFEAPENKDAIQIKKYIDCFGSKQTASATYTVTIAVDLPVDNDPGAFFNWSDASPGHTFIELYKNDNSGLVQQNFGFYPNTSWKTVAGPDNIASKIVDDAGHEYQAKYTIAVTATQFQQALQAAQNYSNFNYNIATFNCADYALGVFNAAGGGLAVQKFQIPGFPSNNGSNTPEGVYDAIQGLVQAGKLNAAANSQKQWAGDSHGACD